MPEPAVASLIGCVNEAFVNVHDLVALAEIGDVLGRCNLSL